MTTMLQAADAPFIEEINGKKCTFVLWPTAELIPILMRIRADRVSALKKFIAEQKVIAREAAYMLAKEENANLDPHDAYEYLASAQGVDECLTKSLVWGGMTESEAKPVLERLRFSYKQTLAIRASNIYEIRAPAPPVREGDPNAGKGFGEQTEAPEQPKGFGDQKPVP